MSGITLFFELRPKMLSSNQIAGIFEMEYLKEEMTNLVNFLHVFSHS